MDDDKKGQILRVVSRFAIQKIIRKLYK